MVFHNRRHNGFHRSAATVTAPPQKHADVVFGHSLSQPVIRQGH
jgi:hypothetical protein